MRILLLPIFLLASTAFASDEIFTSDAFGLYRQSTIVGERERWAGHVTYMGEKMSAPKLVQPTSTSTVLVFMGPKSLVAGKDLGQAASISLDSIGNLAGIGNPAHFQIGNRRKSATIKTGIANTLFKPDPRSKIYNVGTTIGSAQSRRSEFRVVWDLASVQPEIKPVSHLKLTPESFHELAVESLFDRFSNRIGSGVGIQMSIAHRDGGHTHLAASTRRHGAVLRLLTRDIDGPALVRAVIGPVQSPIQALAIDRFNSIGQLNAVATALQDVKATKFLIGPFRTTAGYLLNDGALVSLTVSAANGEQTRSHGWVRDGLFEVTLPIDARHAPFDIKASSAVGTTTVTVLRPENESIPQKEQTE